MNASQITQSNRGKIFLLRHEERAGNPDYKTPLTELGHTNSRTVLCSQLERLDIQIIYSSPFLRTLQTIKPFCENSGLKVNPEWSLVESFPMRRVKFCEVMDIINTNYTSFTPYRRPSDNIIIDYSSIKERVKAFFKSLDRSKNILMVTHLPVMNAIFSHIRDENLNMYEHCDYGSIHVIND